MTTLWRHLGNLFVRQYRAEGSVNASRMSAGALRAVRFRREHRALFGLELFQRYVLGERDQNPLFHLSHRYYLSNSFSERERVDCALSHHRFEDAHHDTRYKEAVYHRGGIDLWSRCAGGTRYALRLRATTDLRHEGGLSVVLCSEDTVLCEMSYAWVRAEVLGLGSGQTFAFVTRNQSIHRDDPALQRFRDAFPQNSPAYFCLAAMHGVVQAHGMDRVAGIRHDRQVAFESRFASGFRHSYCDFWQSFGTLRSSEVAHLMPVPPSIPPVSALPAKHRKRALDRRRHWSEIASQAQATLASHVLQTGIEPDAPASPNLSATAASLVPLQTTVALLSAFVA